MKFKIICLILSLVFIIGAFGVNGTYAWFMTYGNGIGEGVIHNFKSGSISYTLVGGFDKSEEGQANLIIGPEQNLLKELTGLPDSLPEDTNLYIVPNPLEPDLEEGQEKTQEYVDTQLRVKVFYTYIDAAGNITHENSIVGQADEDRPFVAQLVTDSNDNPYWRYDEDEYFYYVNPADGSEIIKGGFDAVDPIPLFSAMYYSGENADLPTSAFKNNNNFTVKIVFEAKQADYVTWEYLDEIELDFATGKVPETTTTTQE